VATRKEQKEALRAERLERERREAAAGRRKRMVGIAVAAVLVIAAVIALAVTLLSGDGGSEQEATPTAGAGELPTGTVPPPRLTVFSEAVKASGCEAEDYKSEGQDHVEGPVAYKSKPPNSGDHFVTPAEDGTYTEAPPMERLVHSLEHGRIILWYKPDAPDSVKGSLKALYEEDPLHMIVAPNADMPYDVAASAWTHTIGCPQVKPEIWDALRAFRDRHRDRGPEYVP
jgi:Protein of unknown function (DUF3105)